MKGCQPRNVTLIDNPSRCGHGLPRNSTARKTKTGVNKTLHLLWIGLLALAALLEATPAFAQAQTPITRSQRFSGYINFVTTGGSLRTQSNTGDACALGATSTQALSGVPAGTTILAAYLYWGGSASTTGGGATVIDSSVTLNGATVNANRTFTATYDNAGTLLRYFGGVADVTSRVAGNGSFTFGGLTVNNGAPHCAVAGVTAGWGLVVIYQGGSERLRAINIFDGLQFFRGSSLTLTPDGFRIPPTNIDGRVAVITWEGDPGNSDPLNGFAERLGFNGATLDDGLVPAGSAPTVQQFDGTVNSQGVVTSWGVDVDRYDVSTLLLPGQQSATTVYSAGGDLVLLTAQIVSATSEPSVDLALTKTATGPLIVGNNATYTMTASNVAGPLIEREDNPITVTDVLPAGLSFVSATGTGWTCGAAGQTVTCTRPPTLLAGVSAPPITLTAAVGPAAFPSVVNTATVSSPSFDSTPGNDSASVTSAVLQPDLSTSTKTVLDLNGGEADPGDVLRYTITLIETGGAAASAASVVDDLPANTTGFTLVSIPPGATNASTSSGGANGTGRLDIGNLSVPASGALGITFDVQVVASASPGTPIDNVATITQPNGPGATPAAPSLIVSPSRIPGSGSKPLYVRRLVAGSTRQLSRTPPAAAETFEGVPGSGNRTWPLTPVLQRSITIPANSIAVRLWLTRSGGGSGSRTVVVTLANPTTGFSTSTTQTITPPTTTPSLFTFTLPNAVLRTFPAGSALILTVAQASPTGATTFTRVHPNGATAGNWSRVDLNSNTVINVDSVQAYDAASPAGTAPASFTPGSNIWVRAAISDPFGSFDIASASVSIIDSAGTTRVSAQPMTLVADDGSAVRTYEFPWTVPASGVPLGGWTLRVIGVEGTEGLVTDFGVGPLLIALPPPLLRVQKVSEVVSDPLNGSINPKRIPGAVVRYAITVRNSGAGPVDGNTLVITDPVPPDAALFVGMGSGDPVEFIEGAPGSGLTYSYPTHVTYSNQPGGGAPYTYLPVPDAAGFDANITGLRVAPAGVMVASGSGGDPLFTLRFRVRLR